MRKGSSQRGRGNFSVFTSQEGSVISSALSPPRSGMITAGCEHRFHGVTDAERPVSDAGGVVLRVRNRNALTELLLKAHSQDAELV